MELLVKHFHYDRDRGCMMARLEMPNGNLIDRPLMATDTGKLRVQVGMGELDAECRRPVADGQG